MHFPGKQICEYPVKTKKPKKFHGLSVLYILQDGSELRLDLIGRHGMTWEVLVRAASWDCLGIGLTWDSFIAWINLKQEIGLSSEFGLSPNREQEPHFPAQCGSYETHSRGLSAKYALAKCLTSELSNQIF